MCSEVTVTFRLAWQTGRKAANTRIATIPTAMPMMTTSTIITGSLPTPGTFIPISKHILEVEGQYLQDVTKVSMPFLAFRHLFEYENESKFS